MSDACAAIQRHRGADLTVRGNASPEEMAVLLALVARPSEPAAATPYETWRRTRLAAMRRDQPGPERDR